jgi:BlaI family penicillinase repressor
MKTKDVTLGAAFRAIIPPCDLRMFALGSSGAGQVRLEEIGLDAQSNCPKKRSCITTTNVVVVHTLVGHEMREPKLGKLELQIMETLWTRGQASIREIQEAFPERARPAYTTIQTTVYRLEGKKAVRRVRKLGNFHIFEAAVSRSAAQRKLIDDLLTLFGGRTQPVMAHLIESGKLTLADVKEAEKTLRRLEGKDNSA